MIEHIRPILNRPFAYQLHNKIIGADYRSRLLVRDYIRPTPAARPLPIGCGPGNMLPYLPQCDYLGVDINPAYIKTAKRRYSNRGNFVCERVSQHNVNQLGSFDIVLALGLLHHLDDTEGADLFRLAHAALKPGGRLTTLDGCYKPQQSAATRYLLSRDRGRFVRNEQEYLSLARSAFDRVESFLDDDMLRIPYTHAVIVCTR